MNAQHAVALTSYCRCTCFSNSTSSTIIALKDDSGSSCLDCTRKFCLDYNLQDCKDATEDDVQTLCFGKSLAFLILTEDIEI